MTIMYDVEKIEKYNLYHVVDIDTSNGNQNKETSYDIIYTMSNEKFTCLCLMFEFSNVIYAHILKILIYLRIHCIPMRYILKHGQNLQTKKLLI